MSTKELDREPSDLRQTPGVQHRHPRVPRARRNCGWSQRQTCEEHGDLSRNNVRVPRSSPVGVGSGLTEKLVQGESVKDARGADHGAHRSRERGAVYPDGDERRPEVYFLEEPIILSQQCSRRKKYVF